MEMFTLNQEVARLEAELPPLRGAARLAVLAPLAWHLRQRDTRRAVELADEAAVLLTRTALPEAQRRGIAARLQLVRGEAKWLLAELDAAETLADAALQEFTVLSDPLGRADAHWLRAWLATERGNAARRNAELEMVVVQAQQAGDVVRGEIAEVLMLRWLAFADARLAEANWNNRFAPDAAQRDPVIASWANDLLGIIGAQSSDFGTAIARAILAHEAALATGQIQRAIVACVNIGVAFNNLHDHDAALEWMHRGLELARSAGWPGSIGVCLMQSAEPLRHLGRLQVAHELLEEALAMLKPLAGSRNYGLTLQYMGDLALDQGDYVTALETFLLIEKRSRALGQTDIMALVQRGKAHALSHVGRSDEALQAAQAALTLAREQGDAYNEIAVLKVLAEIHAQHPLPSPAGMSAASAPLHYLHQALDVAATIEGYTVPCDLLETVGREYAKVNNHVRAYEIALQASAAREKTHSQEATNRAIAMQMRNQNERERAEGEHHRQLAESEAKRAEVLQQTSTTLERLSAIGQEITTQLDALAVFQALDRHVHGLLDATSFVIYLTDEDGQGLTPAFGVEAGKPVIARHINLNSKSSAVARCVREHSEILVDLAPDDDNPNQIPGTLPTMSRLFAPLSVGDRVLGVMTVQSLQCHAYTERERLIFRNLCAYGAIALDNAAAYDQLKATLQTLRETQAQLLDKNLEIEQAYKTLEEVSLTDPLTGLRNRRFLLQQLDGDIALTLRQYDDWLKYPGRIQPPNMDLVFFLADLDHFKMINDQYGHAAGDMVLVQIRERLREVFRESDYLIRWGGEEFLLVARATDRSEAESIAERIRLAIASRDFDLGDGRTIPRTCSIGFACFPFLPQHPRLTSWSQVVELADHGLYIAKRGGRNAWVGLQGNEHSYQAADMDRIIKNLGQALQDGEIRAVSHLESSARQA